LLTYLHAIEHVWVHTIFQDSVEHMRLTDDHSIRAIQSTCPKHCKSDREALLKSFAAHQIFREMDRPVRELVCQRKCSVDFQIPIFYSFFKVVANMDAEVEAVRADHVGEARMVSFDERGKLDEVRLSLTRKNVETLAAEIVKSWLPELLFLGTNLQTILRADLFDVLRRESMRIVYYCLPEQVEKLARIKGLDPSAA
jgi:Protein of unknown function (DUF3723)